MNGSKKTGSACNDETSGKKSGVRDRWQCVEEAQKEATPEVRSTVSRTARQAACDMKREPGNERGSGRGTKAKGIATRRANRGERRAIHEASITRIVQCQEARRACNIRRMEKVY